MHIRILVILYLFLNISHIYADLIGRASDSLVHVISHARRDAVKRSASLASDLRLAFRDLLRTDHQQLSVSTGSNQVHCAISSSGAGLSSDGNTQNSGTPTSSQFNPASTASSASPISTSGATGTTTPSSPWELAQEYVSPQAALSSPLPHALWLYSQATLSSVVGSFSPIAIQQMVWSTLLMGPLRYVLFLP